MVGVRLPLERWHNLHLILARHEVSVERRLHQHVEKLLAQNTVHDFHNLRRKERRSDVSVVACSGL